VSGDDQRARRKELWVNSRAVNIEHSRTFNAELLPCQPPEVAEPQNRKLSCETGPSKLLYAAECLPEILDGGGHEAKRAAVPYKTGYVTRYARALCKQRSCQVATRRPAPTSAGLTQRN